MQTALNNFFKIENLSALREVALRQVAEEVEAKRNPLQASDPHPPGRPRSRDERLVDGGRPVGDRRAAARAGHAGAQLTARRAPRLALGPAPRRRARRAVGHLEDEPTEEEHEQLAALRRLASVLGAHLLVERGPDVAHVTQRVARERGTTYVLMGTPARAERCAG